MAVAAALGGASPNFDGLYAEVGRLARKLSIASPRELNDPGVTLQLTKPGPPPEVFDCYIRAFYGREGSPITYKLMYKDSTNAEKIASDGTTVQADGDGLVLNGTTLSANLPGGPGDVLALDPTSGKIIFNSSPSTPGTFSPFDSGNVPLGIIKLDAVTGLDVGLINSRISETNLIIEALNKVLIVAIGNADAAINLRL